MRILRPLFIFLIFVLAGTVLGLLLALTPPGQTWLAGRWLARATPVHATFGSVLLGFSRVDTTGLRCEFGAGTLVVPALEADFPLKQAIWSGHWRLTKLAAKGWTLDLTHPPVAGGPSAPSNGIASSAPAGGTPALREIAGAMRGWLREIRLPVGSSLEGVELEGDALLPTSGGVVRLHVVITGGAGEFAIDCRGALPAPRGSPRDLIVKGRVTVGVAADRAVGRLAFEGQVDSFGTVLPAGLTVKAVTELGRDESVAIAFSRADREVAAAQVALTAAGRLAGSWTANLRAADLASSFSNPLPPDLVVSGGGTLESAPNLADLHLAGQAKAVSSHWEVCDPSLARVGSATLEAGFDLTRRASALAVDKLNLSFIGAERVTVVAATQSFQLDPATWAVTAKNPDANWLDVSLRDLPLVMLPELGPGLAFTAGRISGDLTVRSANGTSTVAAPKPLVATGVALAKDGQLLGQALDLSLDLRADRTPQRGWRVNTAPFVVSTAGQPLVTIEGELSRVSDKDSRVVWRGKWSTDLAALAAQPIAREVRWLRGRTAAGEFSLTTGYSLELKTKFTVVGHNPAHTLTADLASYVDRRGAFTFHAPLRLAVGPGASELTLDGTWMPGKDGARIEAEITAVKVAFEHLSTFFGARPLGLRDAAAALLPTRDRVALVRNRARDGRPFWGDAHGTVKFDLFSVTAGAREFANVAGTLRFDRQSLRLENGLAALLPPPPPPRKKNSRADDFPARAEPQRSPATAEGTLTFDAAAEQPYQLNAKATFEPLDAALLFAGAPAGAEPVLEGRFAVAGTLRGEGVNRDDLLVRSRGELRFTSHNGIVRLLRANVAESLSVDATAKSEAWERLGTAANAILGVPGGLTSGQIKLSKAADAVLDFTYRAKEFAFDEMTVTAGRAAGGAFEIDEFDVRAPQAHVSGTGKISSDPAGPLSQRALSLEVQLAFKGAMAGNLKTAGLLSPDQDALGYTRLPKLLHFGGTLQSIDATEWRDLLLEAAKPPPKPKK